MNEFPWLTVLAAVPLVGSVVVALLPKSQPKLAKQLAFGISLIALALVVVIALKFNGSADVPFQFVEIHDWIPAFGITYSVGVDGIGLVLIALAAILVPITILAGWNDVEEPNAESVGSVKGYFALILVLETLMIGVFAATDVFLFYVIFEAMLIPIYFMIGRYGGVKRSYAAMKFLIYSLLGGLFMLASMIGLYVVVGTFNWFGIVNAVHQMGGIDPTTQKLLFLGFFFAFAIKAPLWPFHTWLPDAASAAKPGTAVLLIGVLDKVGTFGMIRYCLPIFPAASDFYAPVIIGMALVGIFYGAFVALGQNDMKRLFAYSSMSHFGFIALGIFVFTSIGISGSVVYMVAHGLSTAALFLTAGFLMQRRRGSSLLSDYSGVNKPAPVLAGFFLFAALASLALPGLVSFIGEFLVLLGTFQRYMWVGGIATLGIVITAAYVLRVYQKSMTGSVGDGLSDIRDLRAREITVLVPIAALTIFLGLYPAPLLNVVNPAVQTVMTITGQTDPPPTVGLSSTTTEGTQQ